MHTHCISGCARTPLNVTLYVQSLSCSIYPRCNILLWRAKERNVTFRHHVPYFYANLYFACVCVCVCVFRNRRKKDLVEPCTRSLEGWINIEPVFSVGSSRQKLNETVAAGFQTTKFYMLHEQQVIGSVNPWYGNIACHRGEVILCQRMYPLSV